MRIMLPLLAMAVLTACNSSNSDKEDSQPLLPLTGFALGEFVVNGEVTARKLFSEDEHSVQTITAQNGQFVFSGKGGLGLEEGEVYLIEVTGGQLTRSGSQNDSSFTTSFNGHTLSALIEAGANQELIINPFTTGISRWVMDNGLGYQDYQNLMQNLPEQVLTMTELDENWSSVNELGYAISYFNQAVAGTTESTLTGMNKVIASLEDNAQFDQYDLVTPEMVDEFAPLAHHYAKRAHNHINAAGQYAATLNGNEERVKVGVVPDTQGSGDNNSWILQDGLMNFYKQQGVDLVLAVGDLTNSNTQYEYDNWLRIMEKYLDETDVTILPVRGNHEKNSISIADPSGGANIFKENLHFMTEGGEHLEGYEGLTYAHKYKNVLAISIDVYKHNNSNDLNLKNPWLTAYPWIQSLVEKYHDEVDHIFISTHEPMFGRRRNGYWSSIAQWPVTGGADKLKEMMKFFSDNNITYVSGHDHQYSRSAILVDRERTVADELQKLVPVEYFDHMISGNASFKEYTTRYHAGAHHSNDDEAVHERMVSRHTMAGIDTVGLNASIFDIRGNLIEYTGYVAPHTYTQAIQDEHEANEEWDAFDYDIPFKLIDRYSKVKGAHSYILDSEFNSAAETGLIHLNADADKGYAGTQAKLLNYINYTFNTYDSEGNGGISARTMNQDTLLTFSFLADSESSETLTDVLMVSGTQQQDGVHLNSAGVNVTDEHRFDSNRIRYDDESMDGFIEDIKGDLYALGFIVPEGVEINEVEPARYDDSSGQWISQAYPEGSLDKGRPFADIYLQAGSYLPTEIANLTDTERHKINGVVPESRMIWFLSNQDGKFALVRKGSAVLAQ
ncbi:metallophosphoesterase family protein [Vibrio sp. WXL210]|uniref:metallophosphoesterase family protein n=1 Tax=Vibrio sp. WXL210 TaxID=3450709 RepID=UPI003EC67DBC